MARKTPKDRTIGENALYCKNAQWSLRANIKEKYWIPPTASEEKKRGENQEFETELNLHLKFVHSSLGSEDDGLFFQSGPFFISFFWETRFLHYLQNWQLSQECKLENRNSQFKWLFIWGISELLSTKSCDFEIFLQRILKTCFVLKNARFLL